MAEFAIATAAAIALNLTIAYLTRPDQPKGNEDEVIAKSQYGFSIPKPYGTVRVNGCNIFWATKVDKDGGGSGGKGGSKPEKAVYYQNFAFVMAWEEISKLEKIYFSKELVYNKSGDDEETSDEAERLEAENLDIYLGTTAQLPNPHLEEYEGVGNVPAFRNIAYVVVKNYPSKNQGFPTIDVEITNGFQDSVSLGLRDVCYKVGLIESEVEADPVLNEIPLRTILKQDGKSAQSFIEELQKTFFFFVRDKGDRLQFIEHETVESENVIDISLDALDAKEADAEAKELYQQTISDTKSLPSELWFDYLNPDKAYDMGSQPAFNRGATHVNQISIRSPVCLTDEEGSKVAWRLLGQTLAQNRKFEKLMLLPSIYEEIEIGGLISLLVSGEKVFLQTTSIEIGTNYLAEISAVIYDNFNVNRPQTNQYYPQQTVSGQAQARVIPLDIPLIKDSDSDLGIYIGVEEIAGNWSEGTIYASIDNGATYFEIADFKGNTITGTVTVPPNNQDPNIIDTGSEIIVELNRDDALENISEINFFNEQNLALIGNEIIAFQNAELIAPKTYKLTRLLRGLKGTELEINHSAQEKFVLLKGNNTTIIRPTGDFTDVGKNVIFKAVHIGQAIDSVTDTANLTITGEALKPYTPVNPKITLDTATGDLIISWNLRTRRYGAFKNNVGITQVDVGQTFIEVFSSTTSVHTASSTTSEYRYTLAQQTEDFGSMQSNLTFNLAQASTFVGVGKVLSVQSLAIAEAQI